MSAVGTPYLHLGLDPGSDDVGLGGELAPQSLVGLLSGHLLLEHLVSEGNKVLHLQRDELKWIKHRKLNSRINRLDSFICNGTFHICRLVKLQSGPNELYKLQIISHLKYS